MVFRFIRSDASSVWEDKEIAKRFSKYKGIIDNSRVARYLVAKTLECKFDENDSLENLEKLFNSKSNEFLEVLTRPFEKLKDRQVKATSYISLAESLANKYLEKCIFCERRCGVNRKEDEKGYCLLGKDAYVSSAFLHMGEEAPLVPSGTIFFQGCNFGCVFCQNYDISQSWKGQRDIEELAQLVDAKCLASLADNLAHKGAININYVGGDPIPNLYTILGSMKYQTSNTCQLWNSNFYMTPQSLSLILHLMDFWLPDFKYGNNKCAEKYSGIKNYFDVVRRNHKLIHDHGSGEIIIRHLVMPNHIECCSKPILDYVTKEIPNCVVNIMGQYHPEWKAHKYPEIDRRPTNDEMATVKGYAEKLGILYEPVS